jgi:hypothetical protein
MSASFWRVPSWDEEGFGRPRAQLRAKFNQDKKTPVGF